MTERQPQRRGRQAKQNSLRNESVPRIASLAKRLADSRTALPLEPWQRGTSDAGQRLRVPLPERRATHDHDGIDGRARRKSRADVPLSTKTPRRQRPRADDPAEMGYSRSPSLPRRNVNLKTTVVVEIQKGEEKFKLEMGVFLG